MELSDLKAELERLHGSCFGWALSCCGRDAGQAEEVLQAVYLKILEGKARFSGQSSFKTWLFAVIRKTAVSERRKSLLRSLILIGRPESRPGRMGSAYEPDTIAERSETQRRFHLALAQLPSRQRETLHLVFYEGLTLREAAETMGISIGSSRQHYERGKKRLRETLEQSEVTYGMGRRGQKNPGAV
jgi:RNA polymerase sigma factor (sigma-70 family)